MEDVLGMSLAGVVLVLAGLVCILMKKRFEGVVMALFGLLFLFAGIFQFGVMLRLWEALGR